MPLLIAPLGFRPNSVFYGFEAELDQLDLKLHNRKRKAIGSCSVLVWGPPGAGKTHLVRQYVWQSRAAKKYPGGIFWVDAKRRESCYRSFWDIGQAAALLGKNDIRDPDWNASSKFVEAVRRWFESRTGWLLVFDGLSFDTEEQLEEAKQFIPDMRGNSIIYTSVDKTLAGRQRLLNPGSVKVHRLSPEHGCLLLYRGLKIKQPTDVQVLRAMELVKHYEGLPLAIHAASHVLIANQRALETYSITRGHTSTRLAEPFLEIVQALRDNSHVEAVNLITLLSFFNHNVPVALIMLGRKALVDFRLEIRSTDREGSDKRELDNTIAVLVKYGLVERTLQPYLLEERILSSEPTFANACDGSSDVTRSSESNGAAAGDHSRREPQATARGMADDLKLLTLSTPSNGHVMETTYTTIESAAQITPTANDNVFEPHADSSLKSSSSTKSIRYNIDILRIHTVVQNVFRDELRLKDREKYYWWLSVAVKMFILSYALAHQRIQSSDRQGLVRDYREFETQAAALRSYFPKPEKAPPNLHGVRTELRHVLRAIRHEIHIRSPSQSFDSVRRQVQVSIFERSSSTSSDAPDNLTEHSSRASTWSFNDTPKLDSPIEMERRDPLLHADSSDSLDDRGYETDYESSATTTRRSSRDEGPENEIPAPRDITSQRRPSFLQSFLKGRSLPTKKPKDLGEWKPMPAPASHGLSHADVRVAPLRNSSATLSVDERSSRPISAGSEAEAALAAVHRASPPAPRGGRIRSPSRSQPSESAPVDFCRRPLEDRSPNRRLSPLAAGFDPRGKMQSAQHYTRSPSASPKAAHVALAHTATSRSKDLPPLPVEDFLTITRNMSGTFVTSQTAWSSSIPGHEVRCGTQDWFTSRQMPLGYTSQPMSRDTSKESTHSLLSAPAAVPRPASLSVSPQNREQHLHRQPRPVSIDIIAGMEFGRMGEWTTVTPMTPTAPRTIGDSVQFGQMEPVALSEARRRAEEYAKTANDMGRLRERSRSRVDKDIP